MIELKINGNAVKLDEAQEKVLLGYLKPEGGRWKPGENERYWTVTRIDEPSEFVWQSDVPDKWSYDQRNVFKTKEEAQAHKLYLEAVARLRDSSDYVPDHNRDDSLYYLVQYDHLSEKLKSIQVDSEFNYGDPITYETRKLAEQSIKDHKEDWLTFFGVSHE